MNLNEIENSFIRKLSATDGRRGLYFFKYSVSSLIASGMRPLALNMATFLFLGAALVSSRSMRESSTSIARSYLKKESFKTSRRLGRSASRRILFAGLGLHGQIATDSETVGKLVVQDLDALIGDVEPVAVQRGKDDLLQQDVLCKATDDERSDDGGGAGGSKEERRALTLFSHVVDVAG